MFQTLLRARGARLLLASALGAAASGAAAMECAAPDGAVTGALGYAGLSGVEQRLVRERFGAEFAEARKRKVDPASLFAFARCDLNRIEPPELLVMGRAPSTCAAAACGFWVLSRTEDGWLELLETVGAPRLTASSANGWTDLIAGAGPLPSVYKFSAGAYAADTGEEDLSLDPLDEYGAPLDGALQVTWFSVADRMPEQAQRIFDWFWSAVALGEDGRLGALPDEFRAGLAPIVPDAAPAVAIQALSARDCSAEGCRHWIFRDSGESAAPRLVAEFTGFDFNLAASGAFGHRDLVVAGIGGAQVLRHDGQGYALSTVSRPMRPGEARAELEE